LSLLAAALTTARRNIARILQEIIATKGQLQQMQHTVDGIDQRLASALTDILLASEITWARVYRATQEFHGVLRDVMVYEQPSNATDGVT
jgi:hypothetical protein